MYTDGIVEEKNVKLKVTSKYTDLQVFDVYSNKQILPDHEDCFSFSTPFLRTYSNKFLFIEYESYSTKDVELINIRKDGKLLLSLSMYEFYQLPTDEKGRYILMIN